MRAVLPARLATLPAACAIAATTLAASAASAGEPAPLPEDYEVPRSTIEVYTSWEAPRSTVSVYYVEPQDVEDETLEESLGARDDGDATVVQLSDRFLFDFGSADLRPTAAQSLDTVVAVLRDGEAPVEITGHTDSVGGDEINQPLSEDRADAVASYLTEHGIDANRITTKGLGSSEPVADNTHEDGRDNPEGRQQNRRVEIRYADE